MSVVLVPHDAHCARQGMGHSDAAKRISDAWRLHRVAGGLAVIGQWFAASLADGTGGGQLYDSKRDAILHQHHNEFNYVFLCITPADVTPCEAEEYLVIHRQLYAKNMHMIDPDDVNGGRQVIRRVAREDDRSLMRSVLNGGRTRPSNLVYPDRRN